jgi:hypothetical protein
MTEFDVEHVKREFEDEKKTLAKEAEGHAYRYLRAATEAILKNPSFAPLTEPSRVSLVAAFMVSTALAEIAIEVKGVSISVA